MATSIYLGMPPENIKKFIEENYSQKDMTKVPLHFTANEDNSSVSLVCVDQYNWVFTDSWCEIEYSRTGKDDDWFDYTTRQVVNLNKDETVYFRAKQGNVKENPNLNGFEQYVENQDYITHYFKMEGSIKAAGNIQFLLEKTGTKMDVPECCYSHLFYDFFEETGETSLIQAPLLPATTLSKRCYYNMFRNCTSLIKAPELPATTLVEKCYDSMFQGCTSLNNVNVSFSAWDPSYATQWWLKGVAAEGTFTCPAALPDTPRDISHIPEGWTRVDKQ